jgi:hypothetical protein
MKWAVWTSACLSFALLVAAGVVYWHGDSRLSEDDAPSPIVVGQTDFVLIDVAPGRHELVVPISNPAKVPRQIIGLGEG